MSEEEHIASRVMAEYEAGSSAFANGSGFPVPALGELTENYEARRVGYVDALADTVRDLAVAVSLMMGDGNADVDVGALRERLSQIRPRQER